MMPVMSLEKPASEQVIAARLKWDEEVGAGYLPLAPIGPGEAVSQRIVENPVSGINDIILDFGRRGRLLGVEFLDERALPPGLTTS